MTTAAGFRGKIYDDITQCVGNTPLIRLRRVVGDTKAQVVAKLESFNPLWSVKDTIAKDVALSFYKQVLQQHERPAEVLMNERKAFQTSDQTSGTYLAYQFFGHPMMVLQR